MSDNDPMNEPKTREPKVGDVVRYRVRPEDLERLAGRPTFVGNTMITARLVRDGLTVDRLEWAGNVLRPGDEVPVIVTRPWHQPGLYSEGVSCLNGMAFLDGPDPLWVLSAHEGHNPGDWHWPS